MRTFTRSEVEEAVDRQALIAALEDGFAAYSRGEVNVPPVGYLKMDAPPGDVHIKYGHRRGDDVFVIKIASGFYDNPKLGLSWGNYEGPHHHDVPMEQLLPVVVKARADGLLFEAANPRHAHEWMVFRDIRVPPEKILIPGVLSSTTNYIEHPLLVAERLFKFAEIVGRERVIAGTDCGFGTFAGFGPVDPDIAYLKLAAMVEGARFASKQLA